MYDEVTVKREEAKNAFMFKIGEFSKLALITVKALRFYDEEGLLKPVEVDRFTGYRYYSSKQLYDANKIVALRQAGLSIAEIREVLSGSDVSAVFVRRKAELALELEQARTRFDRITGIIKQIEEDRTMELQATVKQIPAYTVFYGEAKLHDFSELSGFIVGLGEECAKHNPGLKCTTPEYCFVTYLDEEFTDTDFNCMYAQAVEKAGVESERVRFQTMPTVTAVSVVVRGAYETNLGPAYAFIVKWIEEHGYKIAGRARECYIDGVWNKSDPADYLTEIQFPVEKK